MGGQKEYSGMTAKIKAMKTKLISKEEENRLTECDSVADFAEKLSQNPGYKRAFFNMDLSDVHRETLEYSIECSGYMDYEKLYKFAGMEQRKFLKMYFVSYEIMLIKKAMRNVSTEYIKKEQKDYIKSFFEKYSKIDYEGLFEAKGMEEIIEKLAGTKYYEPLKVISETGKKSFFDYELALDMFYFKYMWKKRKSGFNMEEKKMIKDTIGTEADMLNLTWIYRAKKYYNMTQSEMVMLIIPIYYKMKKKDYIKIMEASDTEELILLMKKTPYAKFFEKKSVDNSRVEKISKRIIADIYIKYERIAPYSVAIISNYLREKVIEMGKVINILECIRYGYTKEDIRMEVKG